MNKRSIVGIVDEPEFGSEDQGEDDLKLDGYYKALADFIRHTDTPITIGVQGNWGSGKTTLMSHFPVSLALFIESDERTVSTRHFKKLKSKKDVIEKKLGPLEWIPSKRQRQQVRLMADPKLNKEIKKSRRSSGDQTPPEDCHDKIVEFFRQNTKNFVETLENNLTKTQKTQ